VKRAIDARDVSNACIFITVVGEGDSFTVKAVEEHALDNGAFCAGFVTPVNSTTPSRKPR